VTSDDLRVVRMLGFPIDTFRHARQHVEALMREFAFVAAEGDAATTPRRLLELVDALRGRFAGFTAGVQDAIEEAVVRGDAAIDLEYRVPTPVGPAAAQLAAMLDEADEFCRRGALLTLATPPRLRDFRVWFLGEFTRQLRGAPPTPWPEWSRQPVR
jgi:hypothetical protein